MGRACRWIANSTETRRSSGAARIPPPRRSGRSTAGAEGRRGETPSWRVAGAPVGRLDKVGREPRPWPICIVHCPLLHDRPVIRRAARHPRPLWLRIPDRTEPMGVSIQCVRMGWSGMRREAGKRFAQWIRPGDGDGGAWVGGMSVRRWVPRRAVWGTPPPTQAAARQGGGWDGVSRVEGGVGRVSQGGGGRRRGGWAPWAASGASR